MNKWKKLGIPVSALNTYWFCKIIQGKIFCVRVKVKKYECKCEGNFEESQACFST